MKAQAQHQPVGQSFKFIGGIQKEDIDKVWPLVAPMLAKALEYDNSGMRLIDLKDDIEANQKQLWIVADESIRCAAVTSVTHSMYGRHLARIICLAGDGMDEWLSEILDVIEPWAKSHGCEFIEAVGRKGWERAAKKFGYRHSYTVIQKDL